MNLTETDIEIEGLMKQVEVLRNAMIRIYDEPNGLGFVADEIVGRYEIKAWSIAQAALIEFAQIADTIEMKLKGLKND